MFTFFRFSARRLSVDSERAHRVAMILVPVFLGLVSLRLGQDDNWDLKNYHLYNPFALLNGKIGVDLAPAQWQSYFNPTLDLLYYSLVTHLPPRLAGFLMGLLHGLNFLLVLGIARQVLPARPEGRTRTHLLLALAAMLGPAFFSQIGNSMGDNMTSLFVLGAVYLILRGWDRLVDATSASHVWPIGAGMLMGLGCGLKLTNAAYAVALCLALLTVPAGAAARLRLAFVFGVAVLGGTAITAGYWFALMAQTFGNPLFPQFNHIFHAPLAAPIGIGDTGWLPKSLFEKFSWPFVFALNPRRVAEIPLRLWLWPLLYIGMLALAASAALSAQKRPVMSGMGARQRMLLVFFALAYLIWLNLFAIYRYLVPLELLLPMVFWLVASRVLPKLWAARVAGVMLAAGVIVCLPRASWGHAGWARTAFSATVPAFADPAQSMVLTVHGDPPMGWLVTRFPTQLAFAAVGSGFPESPAFVTRVKQMAAMRRGPLFVMMQADRGKPAAQRGAAELAQAAAANQDVLERGAEVLGRYGFAFDPASCTSYPAAVGASAWNYQLCVIKARTSAP